VCTFTGSVSYLYRRQATDVDSLQETTRTLLYYMDEDYPTGPEIQQPLPEWSNWRDSESSILETDVYVWHHTLLVVLKKWMNEWMCSSVGHILEAS